MRHGKHRIITPMRRPLTANRHSSPCHVPQCTPGHFLRNDPFGRGTDIATFPERFDTNISRDTVIHTIEEEIQESRRQQLLTEEYDENSQKISYRSYFRRPAERGLSRSSECLVLRHLGAITVEGRLREC